MRNRLRKAEEDLSGKKPLIFISHHHNDARLAAAFETLLLDSSSGTLECFRSSDNAGLSGIPYGDVWYATVMARLEESVAVVGLLTETSVSRPWILYEVGVARGRTGRMSFGVVFGISLAEVSKTGPFGQFQNCLAEKEQLIKLISQLVADYSRAEPRETVIAQQVDVFLAEVKSMPAKEEQAHPKTSSEMDAVAAMFEDVKEMLRDISMRQLETLRAGSHRPSETSIAELVDLCRREIDVVPRQVTADRFRALALLVNSVEPDIAKVMEALSDISSESFDMANAHRLFHMLIRPDKESELARAVHRLFIRRRRSKGARVRESTSAEQMTLEDETKDTGEPSVE